MYKNNSKHEQTGNPQYYNSTLQKIRNNNFLKPATYFLSAVIGFSAAYNFLKTNLLGADAAELQKNLNETKPIECVLSEEHQPVPYVLLGSQVVGMQTITPFTKEDKGNIASLENSFYGDNFNKYVSSLEERASSIKDEIVISNQGEIFKIKTGKIDGAKYLVGIKKIGEISKHNMKMSDLEIKARVGEEARKRGIDTNNSVYRVPLDHFIMNYGEKLVCGFDILDQNAADDLTKHVWEKYGAGYKPPRIYSKIKPSKSTTTTLDNGSVIKADWCENNVGYVMCWLEKLEK